MFINKEINTLLIFLYDNNAKISGSKKSMLKLVYNSLVSSSQRLNGKQVYVV